MHLSSPATVRNALVVLLSVAAGCVDAVSYLDLGHVFTANMTGNTVLLGLSLGQADWQAALRSGVALVGFIIGVGAGSVIASGYGEREAVWPITVTVTLAVELAVLAAFGLGLYLAGGQRTLSSSLLRSRWASRAPPCGVWASPAWRPPT